MPPSERPGPAARLAGAAIGGGSAHPGLADAPTAALANELLARVRGLRDAGPGAVQGNLASLLGLLAAETDLSVSDLGSNRLGLKRTWLPSIADHPDIDAEAVDVRGACVLELGCGGLNPVAPVADLLLLGVRVLSLDLDALEDPRLAARRAYWSLLDRAARMGLPLPGAVDWKALRAGDLAALPAGSWRFVHAPADATGLPDASVDLAVSVTFLEHVPDTAAVARETARLVRPGGLAIHRVDLQDHRSYADPTLHPLEFLTDPSTAPLVAGCNRIRHRDLLAHFEQAGFEVRRCDVLARATLDDAFLSRLAPRFRTLSTDDLEPLQVDYYLRRRDGG